MRRFSTRQYCRVFLPWPLKVKDEAAAESCLPAIPGGIVAFRKEQLPSRLLGWLVLFARVASHQPAVVRSNELFSARRGRVSLLQPGAMCRDMDRTKKSR